MANAFDDIPDMVLPAVTAAAAPSANAFDDITPPPPKQEAPKKPVTAGDRVQAGEAGILRGGAYLAGAIPDAAANLFNLGKAGLGAGYQAVTGKAGWNVSDPNPVSRWITDQMDKSPVTTTQLARPDDAASRYLATAGSVVPSAATGGGGGAAARVFATAAPPALTGQYVAEKKPFESDWANNAASVAAQAATMAVMPRGRGADVPGNEVRNQTVRDAQEAGMVFPPATTNPSNSNRMVENIAGKQQVQQHATLTNRDAVNEGARADLGLGGQGGISDAELAQVRAQAHPAYTAVRQAGPIQTGADPAFVQNLQGALQRYTGAGRVLSQSGSGALERDIQDIIGHPTSDAADLVDTIGVLRDRAQTAFRAGDAGIGAAYRQASNAVENQIQQGLPPGSPVLTNFQNARRQLAIAHSIEDARNEGTGDINAQKLAGMLHGGVPLQGNLLTAARAASAAPKAFAPVTSSAGVNHLGLWGGILGGAALGHELMPGWGIAPAAAAGGLHAGRLGARMYALGGFGQRDAIPTQRGPVNPSVLLGNYLSSQALLDQ